MAHLAGRMARFEQKKSQLAIKRDTLKYLNEMISISPEEEKILFQSKDEG